MVGLRKIVKHFNTVNIDLIKTSYQYYVNWKQYITTWDTAIWFFGI